MMDTAAKTLYKEIVNKQSGAPVFFHPWWLDAVCGSDGWDALVHQEEENISAVLPFEVKRKMGFSLSRMPVFTPRLGLFILAGNSISTEKKVLIEKNAISNFESEISRFDWFEQAFDYRFANMELLKSQGFEYLPRCTYLFKDLSDPEKIVAGFNNSKKRNLKKALKHFRVERGISPSVFFQLHKKNLAAEGKKIGYSFPEVGPVIASALCNEAGEVFYALDHQEKIVAATLLLWDKESAYYLLSTASQKAKTMGVVAMLVKEMIFFASGKTQIFDFCGSIIKGVAETNRRYGAERVDYLQAYKINSKILSLYRKLLHRW